MKLNEFLESSGLYTKQKLDNRIPNIDLIKFPSVKLLCNSCNSKETFIFQKKESSKLKLSVILDDNQLKREIGTIKYECANCGNLEYFLIELNEKHDYIKKVGQSHELNINVERKIEKLLSKTKIENYKKGLICESQGYGIGAFAYYRRIVEEIIDELLEKTKNIIKNDEEKEIFVKCLEKIESSHNAADKIDIIKNQLPDVLKSEYNYFNIIYSILSSGIHEYDDETCLYISIDLKNTLIDLINQLELYQHPKELNEKTKNLLEKRNQINKKS